jgi:lipid-binding SYLF domain-containing protein
MVASAAGTFLLRNPCASSAGIEVASEQGMATQSKNRKQEKQSTQEPTAQQLEKRVEATLKRLEAKDPGLRKLLKKAYGYAVFPSVGKAALVVGGSYGRGAAFEKGKMIGYATISQMTIGVQVGGDTFTEILVFNDKDSLKRFKQGRMAFAANASAVLVKAAAAGTNNFKGVTALAYSSGGMLLELSLGGQKFKFKPLDEGQDDQEQDKKDAKAKGRAGEEESDEDEEDEQEDEGEDSGMLGRAIDGVKGAASKVGDLAKERPIAATVVGASLATALALLVMRTMRQRSNEDGSDESEDDEEDDTDARASDESEEEESDEQEDEGDDEDRSEEEGDEDEESSNNHVGGRRSHRYR